MSGGERWAELLTAVWKQTPVVVLEEARNAILGMQHVLSGGSGPLANNAKPLQGHLAT